MLEFRIGGELMSLAVEIGLLDVGLRTDRDIFAGCHRGRTGHQTGQPRQHHGRMRGTAGRHSRHDAGGGKNTVIGAEHGGAQPAGAVQEMLLPV